jgi:hypothetical protein
MNPNDEVVASVIRMHNKRIVLQKMKSGNIKMSIANACDNPSKPIVAQQVIKGKIRHTEQQFSPDVMLAISNCYMVMCGLFDPMLDNYATTEDEIKQQVQCDICGHEWNESLNDGQVTANCPNCKQVARFDM